MTRAGTALTATLAVVAIGLASCSATSDEAGPATSTPAAPSSDEAAGAASSGPAATSVRLVAAGDIASSRRSGRGTARLVERLDPDLVLTLGDRALGGSTR